jgi:hypothetical protein
MMNTQQNVFLSGSTLNDKEYPVALLKALFERFNCFPDNRLLNFYE